MLLFVDHFYSKVCLNRFPGSAGASPPVLISQSFPLARCWPYLFQGNQAKISLPKTQKGPIVMQSLHCRLQMKWQKPINCSLNALLEPKKEHPCWQNKLTDILAAELNIQLTFKSNICFDCPISLTRDQISLERVALRDVQNVLVGPSGPSVGNNLCLFQHLTIFWSTHRVWTLPQGLFVVCTHRTCEWGYHMATTINISTSH